ncbi:hypothetical protein [Mycolicibacterium arenosum]|uniref:Lipoprotein LpqN n=1 Tax=Mycolicibacterium arenosum TaxID=2952157 RepID=A0ABT1MBC6_9MYCO|nr:hypothetical protein [Mycolicibacterium sp. CAU 1645]MCP9276469.1 hypothetical protein [Mycolicibacterium sp. CAU 1645]
MMRRYTTASGARRNPTFDRFPLQALSSTAAIALTAIGIVACSPQPAPPIAASGTTQQQVADVSPAGDIPDNQAFVPFTAADGSFTIKVPEGWARTDVDGVSFTDKLNTIAIASRPATVAPTVDSVNQQEMPGIESSTPGFQPGTISQVTRTAGETVLVTYGADSLPNPVTGKSIRDDVERYSYYRPGQVVTVTLSGPVGADNVDPWRIVTDSFVWHP